jgi:hypothetical protein
VGAIAPSSEFEEDGELHVFAPTSEIAEGGRKLVEAIAARLKADVVWAE